MNSVAGSSTSSAHPSNLQRLQRLTQVLGCDHNRVNDLLLLRPPSHVPCGSDADREDDLNECRAHVVFFPGDIQNFEEEMALQPEGCQWLSWSLERVAVTLGKHFPNRHIWLVRASSMHLHKFSSYQNFVESNLFGAPEHSPYSPDSRAFRHLRALLSHGMEQTHLQNPLLPKGDAGCVASGFSLALVGFSKGCVVLNQMVYELAGARADPELAPFIQSITDMYWLDGGHPGGSETWVTDRRVLEELASSPVQLHVHVTPYEVCDPMRAWVGREHQLFIKTLEELGSPLKKKLHFEDEPASIENHFRIIQEFRVADV